MTTTQTSESLRSLPLPGRQGDSSEHIQGEGSNKSSVLGATISQCGQWMRLASQTEFQILGLPLTSMEIQTGLFIHRF